MYTLVDLQVLLCHLEVGDKAGGDKALAVRVSLTVKCESWESLMNLANRLWLTKLKSFKLVLTVHADLLIHQTFFCQMLEKSQFAKLPAKPSHYTVVYPHSWLHYRIPLSTILHVFPLAARVLILLPITPKWFINTVTLYMCSWRYRLIVYTSARGLGMLLYMFSLIVKEHGSHNPLGVSSLAWERMVPRPLTLAFKQKSLLKLG